MASAGNANSYVRSRYCFVALFWTPRMTNAELMFLVLTLGFAKENRMYGYVRYFYLHFYFFIAIPPSHSFFIRTTCYWLTIAKTRLLLTQVQSRQSQRKEEEANTQATSVRRDETVHYLLRLGCHCCSLNSVRMHDSGHRLRSVLV